MYGRVSPSFFIKMTILLTITLILASISLLLNGILLFFFYQTKEKINTSLNVVSENLRSIYQRIDNLFTVDIPEENVATKQQKQDIEFSENELINLPKNLKLDVEGDDSEVKL